MNFVWALLSSSLSLEMCEYLTEQLPQGRFSEQAYSELLSCLEACFSLAGYHR